MRLSVYFRLSVSALSLHGWVVCLSVARRETGKRAVDWRGWYNKRPLDARTNYTVSAAVFTLYSRFYNRLGKLWKLVQPSGA